MKKNIARSIYAEVVRLKEQAEREITDEDGGEYLRAAYQNVVDVVQKFIEPEEKREAVTWWYIKAIVSGTLEETDEEKKRIFAVNVQQRATLTVTEWQRYIGDDNSIQTIGRIAYERLRVVPRLKVNYIVKP